MNEALGCEEDLGTMKMKKRILVLNYEFPPLGGGASSVSYEIAKGYVNLGHQVDVVTMGFKGLPAYEKKDGINIYRVPCLRTKKEICHPWEQLTYILSAKRFLRQHLKTHNYDINHTHFIIPTGIVSLWLKKKYDLPYIITSHGSDVLGYNNKRIFKYIYPLVKNQWEKVIKEANTTIIPSRYLKDKINKITKEGKYAVIPNGIDKYKFKPMKKEKRILVVARLFENKGIQDILDALKPLAQELKQKGWEVDIVGNGPYKHFLENKSKENNLRDIVKFHGWVDNKSQKMKKYYGKASIFISASWFESFGLTILEAMQSECHVLVSNIPGYKQLDLNNEDYFKLKNTGDLTIKIRGLINNKDKLRVKDFDKRFEWENIIKKYDGVLK